MAAEACLPITCAMHSDNHEYYVTVMYLYNRYGRINSCKKICINKTIHQIQLIFFSLYILHRRTSFSYLSIINIFLNVINA